MHRQTIRGRWTLADGDRLASNRATRPGSHRVLRISDLVAEAEFGVRVAAGGSSLDRPVEGIHLSELGDPTPWMVPNSLLLSTGLYIAGDPAFGVDLVETMAAAHMAGIGVALGHYLDALPAEMIERADERSLPLFTVPIDVPFRRITSYVYYALSARDTYRLRRALSVQNDLLELLIDERGPTELVARLAELLETTVLLMDRRGDVLAETQVHARLSVHGRRALWQAYRDHRERREVLHSFTFSGYRVAYREATILGRVDRVLLAVYANRPLPELAETTLSYAQKLVTLDRLRERDVAALERRMRTSLLDDLVSGIGTERDLAERMAYHGLDPKGWWRLTVLDIDDVTGRGSDQGDRTEEQIQETKSAFLDGVDRFLADHGLPYLTVPKSDMVAALIQLPDTDKATTERSLMSLCHAVEEGLGLGVSVGVSAPGRGAQGVQGGFRQALEAVRLAKTRRGPDIRFFDRLDPQERLLELQSDVGLLAVYTETVEPLFEHDRLRGTRLVPSLRAFLDEGLSSSQAAAALHVHRNTFRKRLEQVEAILGLSLSSTDDVVSVSLGLKAYDVLRADGRLP